MIDPRALSWVVKIEGGLVLTEDPRDSGGVTFAGITVPALVGIRTADGRLAFDLDGDGDVDAADIRALAALPDCERAYQVERVYDHIWMRVAPGLNWPFSLLAFDAAVHHGPRVGVALLQRALDVEPDGLVGPHTCEAARLASPRVTVERSYCQRADLFRAICNRRAKDRAFLLGWLNRIAALSDVALGRA